MPTLFKLEKIELMVALESATKTYRPLSPTPEPNPEPVISMGGTLGDWRVNKAFLDWLDGEEQIGIGYNEEEREIVVTKGAAWVPTTVRGDDWLGLGYFHNHGLTQLIRYWDPGSGIELEPGDDEHSLIARLPE